MFIYISSDAAYLWTFCPLWLFEILIQYLPTMFSMINPEGSTDLC